MAAYTDFYVFGADGIVPSGTLTWRGTWQQTAASQFNVALDPLKIRGGPASRAVAETQVINPWDVGIFRAISRPLKAQTISGTLNFILGLQESNAAADFITKLHVYIRVGKTDAVRATLIDNYVDSGATEWPTTSTGTQLGGAAPIVAGAAQEGDTLVIEFGYRSLNAVSTSRTGTVRIGCMTTNEGETAQSDLTVGSTSTTTLAGKFIFSNAIDLQEIENDTYAAAIQLSGSYDETFDMNAATYDSDEPTPCTGSVGSTHGRYNSMWWQWTCPVDQSALITAEITDGPTTFLTTLQVLTGTPGSFVSVACTGENDPSFESINFAATMGVTYTFLATCVYYGGGTLQFTFTPDIEPASDETIVPINAAEEEDFTTHTAMAWVVLQAPSGGVRHFYYFGEGETPFVPGEKYVWVGTDEDGLTLRLDIYDGTTVHEFTADLLSLDTWYHVIYRKDGDQHQVYLSTEESGSAPVLVLDETVALGAFDLTRTFIFGLLDVTLPRAFKVWAAALDTSTLAAERETYQGLTYADLYNVTTFREEVQTTAGYTDYSGFDHRAGPILAGGGEGWGQILGPITTVRAQRPFFDDFEAYRPGDYTGSYFPGITDDVRYWSHLTQPTANAFISQGTGLNGSQAFETDQNAASIWFEHDDYTGRCGFLSFYSFGDTALSPSLQRGAGVSIGYSPQVVEDDDVTGFDILNDPLGTATMRVINNWTGDDVSIPGVYIIGQWQFIQVFFELSSVPGGVIQADGSLHIFVDSRLVYTASGIELAGAQALWGDEINTWNAMGFAWSGWIDNVSIGTACYEDACPGERSDPRTDGLPYAPFDPSPCGGTGTLGAPRTGA